MRISSPIYFLASLVLIVGLACALGGGETPSQPTPPPTSPPEQAPPTQPPAPPATAVPPTDTEVPSPPVSQFFTEEFDSPLTNDWTTFTVSGSAKANPDDVTVDVQNGKLVWNFDSEDVYYYLFYEANQYEDVQVAVSADNRGRNNNNISLICRYDPDTGWYEFNIANNGLYWIYYAEIASDGDISYNLVTNGGSNAIKQGKEINEYTATCKGTQLTLTINGDEVNSVSEKTYGLREGAVGLSVSSFNVLPILIEMDWFKISEP